MPARSTKAKAVSRKAVVKVAPVAVDMSALELRALLEDLTIEAQSRLRTLKQAQLSHLATLQRHWKLNVTALDDKIRTLSLRDFITLHAGDEQAALRAVVANELASAPMGAGEQGARIRKRAAPPPSPSETKSSISTSRALGQKEGDDSGAGAVPGSSKRAKPDVSSKRTGARGVKEIISTTATRSTRARPRGATASTSTSTSAAVASPSNNFIYTSSSNNPAVTASSSRQSIMLNARLPPTPSLGQSSRMTGMSMIRKPRRGESIVMLSVNDSPLGVGFADEDNSQRLDYSRDAEDADEAHAEDQAGDVEWDMMDKNEASGVEDQAANVPRKKPFRKVKGKSKAAHSSASAPTSAPAFIPPSTEFTFKSTLEQLGSQLAHPGLMTEAERTAAQIELRKLLAMI